ncbi:MAG: hypothetical protein J5I81_07105 [Nitrococcus mobilis]|nr:hypothetical protein [Nitrococcus mobilis]
MLPVFAATILKQLAAVRESIQGRQYQQRQHGPQADKRAIDKGRLQDQAVFSAFMDERQHHRPIQHRHAR